MTLIMSKDAEGHISELDREGLTQVVHDTGMVGDHMGRFWLI